LSPAGGKIAYFESGTLYIADQQGNSTIIIDSQTDGKTVDWSPDGGGLAYISVKNENNAIYYVLNITDDSAIIEPEQLMDSIDNESGPVWAPDGKHLVFARSDCEGGYSVFVAPLNTGGEERLIQQCLNNLNYLTWVESGGIAYIDGDLLNIAYLEGYFRFEDMELQPGENIFYATAADVSGNISQPSEEITVIYDISLLPDLETTEDDIYIYPVFPVEGEEAAFNVVVWNNGQADAQDVGVDIYIWDAAGGLELLKSDTIPYITSDNGEIIGFTWDTTGMTGTNTVIVVLDPEDNILEQSEENNFAVREFTVVEEEGLSMTTTLDDTLYNSNQDVNIDLTLINSGLDREVVAEVWVEDNNGYAVTLLDTITTYLPYGTEEHYNLAWNTGMTFAGLYRVHAVLKDLPDTIVENNVPFTILPDMDIVTTLTTDRAGYGPNEDAVINYSVKNNGQNYIIPELTAKISITDAGNNVLFTEDRVLANLLPGINTALNSTWNTGLNAPGEYMVEFGIYINDEPVSTRSVSFTINEIAVIEGDITVTPRVVLFGNSVQADYSIRNSGNAGADGLIVNVLVIDTEDNTVMDIHEEIIDLGINGSHTGRFVFSTDRYSLKTYVAALRYTYLNNTENTASASFTVMDGTPPVVTVISPEDGGLFNSDIYLSVIAADNVSGVDTVEYRVDDGEWELLPAADLSAGRYATAWLPTAEDEGIRTIYFRAVDKAGNTSIPVSVVITIDLTPPGPPVIISPPDNTNLITDTVDISGTAEPGALVEMISGGGYTTDADTATGEFIFTNVELISDLNTFVFTAKDAAGNVSGQTDHLLLHVGISSSATTDKTQYGMNDDVSAVIYVQNTGPEYTIPALTLTMDIIDPSENIIYSEEMDIADLMPGMTTELNSTWNTSESAPGMYRIKARVYFRDQQLSVSTTTFEILGTSITGEGLTGTISAAPDPVYQGRD